MEGDSVSVCSRGGLGSGGRDGGREAGDGKARKRAQGPRAAPVPQAHRRPTLRELPPVGAPPLRGPPPLWEPPTLQEPNAPRCCRWSERRGRECWSPGASMLAFSLAVVPASPPRPNVP